MGGSHGSDGGENPNGGGYRVGDRYGRSFCLPPRAWHALAALLLSPQAGFSFAFAVLQTMKLSHLLVFSVVLALRMCRVPSRGLSEDVVVGRCTRSSSECACRCWTRGCKLSCMLSSE